MDPVCFVVMPFNTKPVTAAAEGAPSSLDCDRLWDLAYRPALEELGYLPIRADIESSGVIVKDMLNRLKHAALVVSDVSLPNGNVYYELGIRHVAKESHCIQIAADWFKPLFDIAQFRTVTYPLPDGSVPEAQAKEIRAVLKEQIPNFAAEKTPYHVLVDDDIEDAFEEEAQKISTFQGKVSAARLMPEGDARTELIKEIVQESLGAAKALPGVALELVYLIRDASDWQAVRDFVEALPESTQRAETIQEQYYLALSELGEIEQAIGGLDEMIRRFGATPERCGLIGGRYKRLYRNLRDARREAGNDQPSGEERKHLNKAIEFYEQGMQLDLNGYYCSCNLPALLRDRGRRGDEERAAAIDVQVVAACRRAEKLGIGDPYLYDTLFGTVFRQGDLAVLEEIADEVESGVAWKLGTMLEDADDWLSQAPAEKREDLEAVLTRWRAARDAIG